MMVTPVANRPMTCLRRAVSMFRIGTRSSSLMSSRYLGCGRRPRGPMLALMHSPRQNGDPVTAPAGDGPGSLLVVTGPPGAGKSTVAKLLAASAEPSVLVEGDAFFR